MESDLSEKMVTQNLPGQPASSPLEASHVEEEAVRDLEFLSRTASRFVQLSEEQDIYRVIGEELLQLTPGAIVTVSSYEKATQSMRLHHILGIESFPEKLLKIFGGHPVGMTFKATPEAVQALTSDRLHRVPGGLYELLFGLISRPVARRIERMFDIRAIYAMGFSWQGELFGDAIILLHSNDRLARTPTIEAFIHQASMALSRRLAEQSLSTDEERLRWLSENTFDLVFRYWSYPSPKFAYLSSAVEPLTGYSAMEFMAEPALLSHLVHPQDRTIMERVLHSPQPKAEPALMRWKRKDGRMIWVEQRSYPIYDKNDRVVGIDAVVRDVTAEKLRMREMETINAVSSALRIAKNRTEIIAILLNQLARLFSAEGALLALIEKATRDIIVAGAAGNWESLANTSLPDSPPGWRKPYRSLKAESDPFSPPGDAPLSPAYLASLPLIVDDRTIGLLALRRNDEFTDEDVRLLTIVADIAAHAIQRVILHEETLQRLQRLASLRSVYLAINSSLELPVVLDVFLKQVTTQSGFHAAAVLLYSPDTQVLEYHAWRGLNLHSSAGAPISVNSGLAWQAVMERRTIVLPDLRKVLIDWWSNPLLPGEQFRAYMAVPLIAKGEVKGALEIFHREPLKNDPESREYIETLANMVALALENTRLFRKVQDQMAALARTQDRMVEREKIAALGELVAGVAHELNNPITAIIGFAQLLRMNAANDLMRQDLDKIIAQAQQAARIVRGLLDFARQRPPEHEPVQINELILNTLDLLSYELRANNITWELSLAPEVPLTLADPNQMQQVLVNLINNAWQSISAANGKGHIQVASEVGPSIYNGSGENGEKVIRITVTDDGPGIPTEAFSRLFNPFFTTKPPGKGTGLGLSICYGIISEHGGHIWADRNVKSGARFVVELPIVSAVHQPVHSPSPERAQPRAEEASILLIEDEQNLAEILVRSLQHAGYHVDPAPDGEIGLSLLRQHTYDLIICDIHLAGISGFDFYQRATALDPSLSKRIIFTTGDILAAETYRFIEETGCPYLSKPFELSDLVELARETIRKNRPI